MIGFLKGNVISHSNGTVILETGGVGFEVLCSSSAYELLVTQGKGEIYTYLNVREDGFYLYGFISKEEMSVFIKDVLTNGMTCGFIGVKYILSVLCELGRSDIAYSLISSVDFASWGYSVVNGATTIWERWDSYVKGKGVNSHSMNSFNHFAFGSCLEWFYSCVLGINLDFNINCVIISPFIDCSGKITQVDGSFNSVLGEVKVSWEVKFFAKKTIAFVEVILPKKLSVQFDFSDWNIISKSVKKDKIIFELKRNKKTVRKTTLRTANFKN